jgi:hypothetical protein
MRLGRLLALSVLALGLLPSHVAAQYSCPDQGRFWDPAKCVAFLETRVLQKFPGLFKRDGQRLVIPFANGRQEVFTSGEREKGREESSIGYVFLDYFPKIHYGLVRVAYYEGAADLLLNMKTGMSTEIEGDPVFSPDGFRFAVARDPENAGLSGVGGVSIYRVASGKVTNEFSQQMADHSVEDLRWQGNMAVSFVDLEWSPEKRTRRIVRGKPAGSGALVWKID